jgi:hypothetical protein
MNRARALLLAVSAVLASACASVPMATLEADQAAKQFRPPSGMVGVYVYRNESMGGAVRMSVTLDGYLLGDTAAKTFLYTPVAPGRHLLVSKTENDSELVFEATAGANAFVWQEVKMGILSARSQLTLMDDAAGKAGVLECKLGVTSGPPQPVPVRPAAVPGS